MSSLQPPTPPRGCVSSVHAQTIITLNASITTPDALIIPVTSETIPDTQLMSLVDSGSSDLFINLGFVEKHHLVAYTIPAIRLRLIDSTCNSIITQAIKLHIHFSSSKKQTVNFYVTPLDSSCTLILGHCWLTTYNPSIDWVKGSIRFHTKVTPVVPPSPTPMLSPEPEATPVHLKLSPADQSKPGKPPRVTLINAKFFTCKSTMQGSQCFCLQVTTPEATGWSATNLLGPINLGGVPKDYHDFADVFSKSKAGVLANHCPYDLKITLEDGASPPLGPIYSLSQEELLALCKFIDKNTATGFIRPSRSPHGAPVLFVRKKDGSL